LPVQANRLTVPFSDPSRPGTVIVSLLGGSITVRGSSAREVTVTSEGVRESNETTSKAAGLRRLSRPIGVSITEGNNTITIGSSRFGDENDVDLQVPTRTNLKLSTINGDDVVIENVDGEIEVTAVNGGITLTNVSGTVVAHATNDDVHVTLRQVTPDKPMAFTSLNGDVDVTMPASMKANLKLRSDQGEVYTDFDVQLQQQRATRTAAAPAPPVPPLPPLPPLPPGASQSENERQLREHERAMRELERQIRGRSGRGRFELDSSIYGTINGGGPEIELRTFNGSIYLRRSK
jgi:DUF4097 and DUF4098 domain-containing protein YvlB